MVISKTKKASGRTIPIVKGLRIKVSQIYREHVLGGKSPAEIVSGHPSLTLASVYEAISYAFSHLKDIRKELVEERKLFEQLRKSKVIRQRDFEAYV